MKLAKHALQSVTRKWGERRLTEFELLSCLTVAEDANKVSNVKESYDAQEKRESVPGDEKRSFGQIGRASGIERVATTRP